MNRPVNRGAVGCRKGSVTVSELGQLVRQLLEAPAHAVVASLVPAAAGPNMTQN